ncbi:MAG: hypothetical protein K1X75_09005 [Leptospirales bacterium]|nr:hypothetical protein [Leptospirales bacterium]
MTSLFRILRYALAMAIAAAAALLISCAAGDAGGEGSAALAYDPANEPDAPTEQDDPFLRAAPDGTTFRILIDRDGYHVRQLARRELFRRKKDIEGDREQFDFFRSEHDKADFMDLRLEGVLQIRLNPLSGAIEHIAYLAGRTPRTWQASKFFQDDISRFRFDFLAGGVNPREFKAHYLWVIHKREGLSDEEQRRRAIEYLNSQVR